MFAIEHCLYPVFTYFCKSVWENRNVDSVFERYVQKDEYTSCDIRKIIEYNHILENIQVDDINDEKFVKVVNLLFNRDLCEMFIIDLCIEVWNDIFLYFLKKIRLILKIITIKIESYIQVRNLTLDYYFL
jgi:hypothetical protein